MMRFGRVGTASGVSPPPSGEVGAKRRVRGYGLSIEQRPLTRFAAQIDLSPSGRGDRIRGGATHCRRQAPRSLISINARASHGAIMDAEETVRLAVFADIHA